MIRASLMTLFALEMVSVSGCGYFKSNAQLRNAQPRNPSVYFQDVDRRIATITACHAGSSKQQEEWAVLEACRCAEQADLASRDGWKL